jgi:hypothetical protein
MLRGLVGGEEEIIADEDSKEHDLRWKEDEAHF